MNFDIESIKRKMLIKYPFFGGIVANVNYKETTRIPKSSTNGQTIFYNQKFLESLDPDEQVFVFAHEVFHIAFDHIGRRKGKDRYVWNKAADGVTNQFLMKDGFKPPKNDHFQIDVIDIPEAINYNVEQLYDKLLKEKQQNQDQNGQSNQQEGQSYDIEYDIHSMWDDAIKKRELKSKNNKDSQLDEEENEEQEQKEERLRQEIEKISQMGEQNAFKKNLQERREKLEELKNILSQQAMGTGTSTNSEQRFINNIGKSKPLIDWRYVLRETIKYDVDWSYKNAYVEDRVVIANLEEQPMPETEIVLDTSGSIDELLLKNFLRECKNILKYSRLKVGCFDTEFYGFHEIRTEEDIENMKFEGDGGTDFNVAVSAFTKRVENKIIFTDGLAEMPDTPLNAIWIVLGEAQIHPKGGKVIQINGEQLEKLSSYDDTSYNRKIR